MEEEKKELEVEESETPPLEERKETFHFPWTIAIMIGVLMVLIIACFIVIMILGPEDPATSSSEISTVLGVKIINFLYKIIAI